MLFSHPWMIYTDSVLSNSGAPQTVEGLVLRPVLISSSHRTCIQSPPELGKGERHWLFTGTLHICSFTYVWTHITISFYTKTALSDKLVAPFKNQKTWGWMSSEPLQSYPYPSTVLTEVGTLSNMYSMLLLKRM